MAEPTSAKQWLLERVEELSERRAEEVWEIRQAPRGAELPTHFSDGEPIPGWVFGLREVLLRKEAAPET